MNTNLPAKVKAQITARLPAQLRYDGIQPGAHSSLWLQFTELDENSASFGASFYLNLATAMLPEIKRRRAEKRAVFAAAAAYSPRLLAHDSSLERKA
jgi:hypothetical protein